MLITSLSFQFNSTSLWEEVEIISKGSNFTEDVSKTANGPISKTEVKVYSPYILALKEEKFNKLTSGCGIFKITDNSGITRIIGRDENKAKFQFTKRNDGSPGAKYGYDLKINWESITGSKIV